MKKLIQKIAPALLLLPILALGVSVVADPAAVFAATTPTLTEGIKGSQGTGVPSTLFGGSGSIFTVVVNVLLFVIGAISVIMLIVGGIRYTISNGDAKQVEAAKNTIMYAIIGLVIAFLAFAIVNWIIGDALSSASK